MSLKQKALLQTLALLGTAIVSGIAITFIMANVSTQVLINAMGVGFIAWLGYMVYSLMLSRLEYQETLKEMTEKKG